MSQANILIVDDEKLDRYLLTRDLKRSSVEANIVEFNSGVEALEFLRDFEAHETMERQGGRQGFPPQIIFLDINMPRLSGLAFLDAFKELRSKHDVFERCSIMMMSSSEHPDDRERALRHEFVTAFVTKGQTDAAELGEMIQAALAA